MQQFDTDGWRTRLLNADKEANAFANYTTEHKYFMLWTVTMLSLK